MFTFGFATFFLYKILNKGILSYTQKFLSASRLAGLWICCNTETDTHELAPR